MYLIAPGDLCPQSSMNEIRDELDPPFEVLEPAEGQGPVLFNSPHSGSTYPRDFLAVSRLDIATLRRSEDSFVDELFAGVVQSAFRSCARISRAASWT